MPILMWKSRWSWCIQPPTAMQSSSSKGKSCLLRYGTAWAGYCTRVPPCPLASLHLLGVLLLRSSQLGRTTLCCFVMPLAGCTQRSAAQPYCIHACILLQATTIIGQQGYTNLFHMLLGHHWHAEFELRKCRTAAAERQYTVHALQQEVCDIAVVDLHHPVQKPTNTLHACIQLPGNRVNAEMPRQAVAGATPVPKSL